MAAQSPVRLLAVFLFLHIWVPTACIERTGAHEALEVSLDKHGVAHMRREPVGSSVHEDAFRSAKHTHHTQTRRSGMLVERQPNGGLEEPFTAASDSTGITYASTDASTGAQAAPTGSQAARSTPEATGNTLENVWDDEKLRDGTPSNAAAATDLSKAKIEIEKVDKLIISAEEKAGMPDSLKTTEEPQQLEPTEEEQEGTAMVIAVISIVVIIGAGSAGYSMWLQRQPEKNDQPLLRGEGQASTQYTGEGARKGEEGYGDAPIDIAKSTHTAGSINTVKSEASKDPDEVTQVEVGTTKADTEAKTARSYKAERAAKKAVIETGEAAAEAF